MVLDTEMSHLDEGPPSLRKNQRIESAKTGDVFVVGKKLGEGGFGSVYECHLDGNQDEKFAIKVTIDQSSWVREVYFGQILRNAKNTVALVDSFPMVLSKRWDLMGYVIVTELAFGGSLCDVLVDHGPMSEKTSVSNFKGILAALNHLHEGGAVHRDLTPKNIFVDDKGRFLLGDFGIAKHEGSSKGVRADIFNPWYRPPEINVKTSKWGVQQDIWQMGQLLAITIHGDPIKITPAGEVRLLECSAWLKEVIFRAVGPMKVRYRSAFEMQDALKAKASAVDLLPKAKGIKSLKGLRVVFTGKFPDMSREDAAWYAKRKGAVVSDRNVSALTDLLVVGETTSLMGGGTAGSKIIDAVALNELGACIRRMTPRQFLNLIK